MTVRDFLVSIVRTVVPVIAGFLLAAAAKAGLDLSAVAEPLVDAVFIGGYYVLVRWAESRWPVVGVLLGWKASPSYDLTATKAADGTFVVNVPDAQMAAEVKHAVERRRRS